MTINQQLRTFSSNNWRRFSQKQKSLPGVDSTLLKLQLTDVLICIQPPEKKKLLLHLSSEAGGQEVTGSSVAEELCYRKLIFCVSSSCSNCSNQSSLWICATFARHYTHTTESGTDIQGQQEMAGSRLESWGHHVPVNLGRIGCGTCDGNPVCKVICLSPCHPCSVVLRSCEDLEKPEVTWARMSFKPQRSWSLPQESNVSGWETHGSNLCHRSQSTVWANFFYQQSREQSNTTGNQPMTSALGFQLGTGQDSQLNLRPGNIETKFYSSGLC